MSTKKRYVLQTPIICGSEEDAAVKLVKKYYQRKTGHQNWSGAKLVSRLFMEKSAEISKDLI